MRRIVAELVAEKAEEAAYPVGVTGNCGHIYAAAWSEE